MVQEQKVLNGRKGKIGPFGVMNFIMKSICINMAAGQSG